MKHPCRSIGKQAAIELAESGWWEGKTSKELVYFQLFTEELSMPFDVFHKAIEEELGRPVFTHEFGENFDGICDEFLGNRAAPSMEDIIDLIPEEKRVIIVFDSESHLDDED